MRFRRDKLYPITKEESRLIQTILQELHAQFNSDPSAFSQELSKLYADGSDDMDADDGKNLSQTPMYSQIKVWFKPERSGGGNHPRKDIKYIGLEWVPTTGILNIQMEYTDPNVSNSIRHRLERVFNEDFLLDKNSTFDGLHGNIKKSVYILYKKIKKYQDIDVPEKRKKEFEQTVYEIFPALLDEIILEDEHGD